MTSSIANETVDHSKNREPFSFYKFITNKYFLNVVSIVLFLALWDYVAKEKIFRDSLARPLEVVDQLYRLTYMKFAGTNLIGHIWASTQRVLIGFIAASVVAVPLGLFMALNKYVNAIVKPLFDLFKPMPPIAWVSIAILWFGIGEMSKVFIIIIGTFVPCLLNAHIIITMPFRNLQTLGRRHKVACKKFFFLIGNSSHHLSAGESLPLFVESSLYGNILRISSVCMF